MPSTLQYLLPHSALTFIAGFLLWNAQGIHADAVFDDRISPAFWPQGILWLWLALSAGELLKRIVQIMLRARHAQVDNAIHINAPASGVLPWATVGLTLILGYSFLVSYLGFPIATAAFLFCFAWIGGYRRFIFLSIVSLLGSAFLVLIFMKIAYISLPLGSGVFKEISIFMLRLYGIQ